MKYEAIDLTDFGNAIKTLNVALIEYEKDKSNEFVRDSCIQRFEYCYDYAVKMIIRHIKNVDTDPSAVKKMDFQTIIRRAYEMEIIPNSWDKWWGYRDNRAATSHSYKLDSAIAIVEKLEPFYQEIDYLYHSLKKFYETQV